MNKYLKVQLSVLIGILGFFFGGIFNIKKDIIDIIVSASIGWATGFFLTFFIISIFLKENKKSFIEKDSKNSQVNTLKGKKVDIIISDNLDEIYNIKR
ncbi:MAG: hypothetical protein N3E50_01355 [Candidatus Goldbacteria bacterium]|nr:hypothetical protein [Candidatus Goldiibacteriota bacterium]